MQRKNTNLIRRTALLVTLFLTGSTLSNILRCPKFNLGKEKNDFNIINNGVLSNNWKDSLYKPTRKVIRRDSEYFYAQMGNQALAVRILSS